LAYCTGDVGFDSGNTGRFTIAGQEQIVTAAGRDGDQQQ
jgi:hypothetical protein